MHSFGPRRGPSSRRSADGCRPWARPSCRHQARRPRRRLDRWCPSPRRWERRRRSQPPRNRDRRPPGRPLLSAAVHPPWARSRGCGTGLPRRLEWLPTPPSRGILRARNVRASRRLERLRPVLSPTWRVRGSRESWLQDARWRRSIAHPTRRQPLSALPFRQALRPCALGLCTRVPDSPPCPAGSRSGGLRPRRPPRSPRLAAGSPSRTCWIHRALGAALSCIGCSRHRGKYECLLPRLRRAGMRAVRAEGSRSLSLAEPIHRKSAFYDAVSFDFVDLPIRAIRRVSMNVSIPGHKVPFPTVSFGSTWERRRLELLSLLTTCRPTPIAPMRIHFGVLLVAERGIEMQMVDYLRSRGSRGIEA